MSKDGTDVPYSPHSQPKEIIRDACERYSDLRTPELKVLADHWHNRMIETAPDGTFIYEPARSSSLLGEAEFTIGGPHHIQRICVSPSERAAYLEGVCKALLWVRRERWHFDLMKCLEPKLQRYANTARNLVDELPPKAGALHKAVADREEVTERTVRDTFKEAIKESSATSPLDKWRERKAQAEFATRVGRWFSDV